MNTATLPTPTQTAIEAATLDRQLSADYGWQLSPRYAGVRAWLDQDALSRMEDAAIDPPECGADYLDDWTEGDDLGAAYDELLDGDRFL
jgi:hypothetical protein